MSSATHSNLKNEKKNEFAITKQCPDLRIPDISVSIAGEFDFSWKLSCLEYVAYISTENVTAIYMTYILFLLEERNFKNFHCFGFFPLSQQ